LTERAPLPAPADVLERTGMAAAVCPIFRHSPLPFGSRLRLPARRQAGGPRV